MLLFELVTHPSRTPMQVDVATFIRAVSVRRVPSLTDGSAFAALREDMCGLLRYKYQVKIVEQC
jgi:hypothetical protein